MRQINRADKNLIKKINTRSILQVIRDNVSISRADIAKNLGLNSATVSSNVADLIRLGLVTETGIGESSGGRKPILLQLDTEKNYILSVYLDASKITAGIISISGHVLKKREALLPKDKSFQAVAAVISSTIEKLLWEIPKDQHKLLGIGMGINGVVDSEKGLSVFSPAFGWHNISLKQHFEAAFRLPVFIDNDVRAMVLAERWFGSALDCDNFILLNIDSGIGSGIFLNGDVYRGAGFGAGEIGHIHITDAKVPCSCGKLGCLEALASSTAVIKQFDPSNTVTIAAIYKKALAGDAAAAALLETAGSNIGKAVAMTVNILNPKKILLTGELSNAKKIIHQAIQKEILQWALESNANNLIIENALLGEDLGIIGAATLVIKEVYSIDGIPTLQPST